MRQAIFVVVMVGAAFLGGAAVNGPGLHWAQARILDYMGLQDGGEITSINLPQAASNPAEPHRPETSTVAGQPSSLATTQPADSQAVKQSTTSPFATGSSRSISSPPSLSAVPPLPLPAAIPELGAPTPAGKQAESTHRQSSSTMDASSVSGPTPAPLDPSVGTALLASRSPTLVQPNAADQATPPAISLEIAPAPSSPVVSSSPISSPASSIKNGTNMTANSSGSSSDWASLRRKMQSLGVTSYTIEGEPGGRVVFWCLIPLAGRQAVSQRFEGEGDDESQAAQAAIRRITLWQATRSAPPPASP